MVDCIIHIVAWTLLLFESFDPYLLITRSLLFLWAQKSPSRIVRHAWSRYVINARSNFIINGHVLRSHVIVSSELLIHLWWFCDLIMALHLWNSSIERNSHLWIWIEALIHDCSWIVIINSTWPSCLKIALNSVWIYIY